MSVNYAALDPGIRWTVRMLVQAGFETTDSGDGVSKPAELFASGYAIPFPHVVAKTTPATMVADAVRMADLLGPDWTVEATYLTHSGSALLFARTRLPEERRP